MTRANFDQISVEEEIRAGTHDCDVSGCSSVAHYPKKRGGDLGNVIVGGERDICSGPECIGHEGGGRESGLTVGKTLQRVKSGVAAANPATHRHSWEGLYCPEDKVGSSETIRPLEAELAALEKEAVEGSWRARAEKAEARVKVLEADLARHQDGERTAK